MAEKLCQLKKKGGGSLKETTLWTNPNPTSDYAADSTITLSQSYTAFDFIKINYKSIKNSSNILSTLMPVDDFSALTTNTVNLALAVSYNSAVYGRRLYPKSNTSIFCSGATQWYGTGTNQSLLIPVSVVGEGG